MSKNTTRIICIVLAALMLVGFISMIAGSRARAVTQAEIDKLQAERDEIRRQKKDIQEQINALQSEMASVIDKKSALDEQNELNRQDIELINAQIELYDQMIEERPSARRRSSTRITVPASARWRRRTHGPTCPSSSTRRV